MIQQTLCQSQDHPPRFSLAQHLELGTLIKAVLETLGRLISHDPQLHELVWRAICAADDLRWRLYEIFDEDYGPEWGGWDDETYFFPNVA